MKAWRVWEGLGPRTGLCGGGQVSSVGSEGYRGTAPARTSGLSHRELRESVWSHDMAHGLGRQGPSQGRGHSVWEAPGHSVGSLVPALRVRRSLRRSTWACAGLF